MAPTPKRDDTTIYLPICIRCGKEVKYTCEDRCEDCFAEDSEIYHGRDQFADTK